MAPSPSKPGTVPKLQGPFTLDLNIDDEVDDELELKVSFLYLTWSIPLQLPVLSCTPHQENTLPCSGALFFSIITPFIL